MNTAEAIIQSLSEQNSETVGRGLPYIEGLRRQEEGLSEYNTVKVWLELQREFSSTYLNDTTDGFSLCAKGRLHKALTERMLAEEAMRVNCST